jgi:hypothetical protein
MVLASGGAALHIYTDTITRMRVASASFTLPGYTSATFAGLLIEVIFLIAGLIAMYAAAILAPKEHAEKD